jgi:hypothetical protein
LKKTRYKERAMNNLLSNTPQPVVVESPSAQKQKKYEAIAPQIQA